MLDPPRWEELQRLLLRRALVWAGEVAPGRVSLAVVSDQALPSDVEVGGVDVFAPDGDGYSGRLAAAVERVQSPAGAAPLLIAWPELPTWRSDLAPSALDDLSDECEISVGPVFDGGFYLLALSKPLPDLFALPGDGWRGPDVMGTVLGFAHQSSLSAGLLRAERGLRTASDVRAALADPLLDDELRELLTGSR
jgi:glycosyltransferase A (GT-A) superfamily protein (DUF2064 family)